LDVFSLEDVEALRSCAAATLEEVRGLLHAHVQRVGVAALDGPMSILWALDAIPMWQQLSLFAGARQTLPHSVVSALAPVNELQCLVSDLECSKPLRTVLQACLVTKNVLAQNGATRLRAVHLPLLCSRKLRPEGPSVMRLVAHNLEATHEHRCRLRFLRMMAVGKVPTNSHFKQLIWTYLDDLQESPWDAVALLKRCANKDPTDFDQGLIQEMHSCRSICSTIREYQTHSLGRTARISQQTQDLAESALEAEIALAQSQGCLAATSQALLELFGGSSPAPNATTNGEAAEVLHALSSFGCHLEREMDALSNRRRRGWSRSCQRGERWGTWKPVATDTTTLYRTQDPDLVRLLRNPQSDDQARLTPQIEAGGPRLQHAEQSPKMAQLRHSHLLHGGPDGEFQKCEVTGRWIPIGHAAIVAERDRGERGATAGFFTTF